MLGAVKGDPEAEEIPLFRLLARRWQSLAPVQRERVIVLSTPKDEPRRTARLDCQEPARDLRAPDDRAADFEARLESVAVDEVTGEPVIPAKRRSRASRDRTHSDSLRSRVCAAAP